MRHALAPVGMYVCGVALALAVAVFLAVISKPWN